jgi:hypothetical protein
MRRLGGNTKTLFNRKDADKKGLVVWSGTDFQVFRFY